MPAKHYAIIRLKKAKSAWNWAVHLRRSGEFHSKFFPDLKFGGSAKALAAAIEWRDAIASKNILTLREFNAMKRSNNTSGTPGVHFRESATQPLGAWQAKIKLPDGRFKTRAFAVKKFGDRAAYRLAVAARKAMLDALDDRLYLKSATAKRLARYS